MRVTVKDRRRLKFRGSVYNAGDSVDLPARIAQHWIDQGRVVEAKAVSGSKNKAVQSSANKSKDELYALAQEQEVEGRSQMSKDELIKALETESNG